MFLCCSSYVTALAVAALMAAQRQPRSERSRFAQLGQFLARQPEFIDVDRCIVFPQCGRKTSPLDGCGTGLHKGAKKGDRRAEVWMGDVLIIVP